MDYNTTETARAYFEKLNDIYSTLPKGDCAGCGNCCMESVGINLIEFLNIYRYLAEKQELRECSIERIVDYYFMELMKKDVAFRLHLFCGMIGE